MMCPSYSAKSYKAGQLLGCKKGAPGPLTDGGGVVDAGGPDWAFLLRVFHTASKIRFFLFVFSSLLGGKLACSTPRDSYRIGDPSPKG